MTYYHISDNSKSTYTPTAHPVTNDPMWLINDIDLPATGDVMTLVDKFINENKHNNYTLSIFNSLNNMTMEIFAPLPEMPKIVSAVYYAEKAMPLKFVGVDSLTDSYVVGMPLMRGRFKTPGYYKAEDGKLKNIDEDEFYKLIEQSNKD